MENQRAGRRGSPAKALRGRPGERGATPDRDAVQAREHGGLTPAKLTRVLLTRALARGKRAGEIGFGGRPGGDGDRARAVGCARSNRSGRRISTSGVAFSRRIWSMGPSGLPGGPNTNVRSPMANHFSNQSLRNLAPYPSGPGISWPSAALKLYRESRYFIAARCGR